MICLAGVCKDNIGNHVCFSRHLMVVSGKRATGFCMRFSEKVFNRPSLSRGVSVNEIVAGDYTATFRPTVAVDAGIVTPGDWRAT
jgi:hypothetical protein